MSDATLAELEKVVETLEKQGGAVEASAIAKLAPHICKVFDVKADEVAVLTLASEGKFLRFLVPEKLEKVGDIPMTSMDSLAVRTARDKRPEVINNFSTSRHPTVFEAVPLGQQRGEPIQKIMSAPIALGNQVYGVVQISRKAKTVTAAGPDFTPKDLSHLVSVGHTLARCLKLYPAG